MYGDFCPAVGKQDHVFLESEKLAQNQVRDILRSLEIFMVTQIFHRFGPRRLVLCHHNTRSAKSPLQFPCVKHEYSSHSKSIRTVWVFTGGRLKEEFCDFPEKIPCDLSWSANVDIFFDFLI